jgi:hypothetical protein
MARSLVLVAVAGIAIWIISLSLAAMISPSGLWLSLPWIHEKDAWVYRFGKGYAPFTESGEIVTRELSWEGGDRLDIDVPGVVHYAPGSAWRVTVKGRQSSVERLRLEAGRIFLEGRLMDPWTSSLEVRITGPSVERFGLNGSGKLIIENIAQTDLELDLFGSGSVRANGTVDNLQLRIFGSANAELSGLAAGDSDTRIFGSGNADLAPGGDVEVSIFGSGDVRLHTRPRNVSTRMMGSGRVIQLEPRQPESPVAAPGQASGSRGEIISI